MNFFHEHHEKPLITRNKKSAIESHLHYEVEIIVLFEGTLALTVGGKDYTVNKGDFLIVFPNVIHSYKEGERIDIGKFIFSPEALPELKDIFKSNLPLSPIVKGSDALTSLADEIISLSPSSSPAVQKGYLLLLTGKLFELTELVERDKFDVSTINSVFNYCQSNFRMKLTEKEVAKALHLSDSYLSHIFSKRVEMNFCTYLNTLRVNEACRLLTSSDKSVTEIAEDCGFGSLRTFNRVFSAQLKMTPREYRKRLSR